ncbi:signal peptidase I [Halorarius halobius]|uniref:signal peptidase I n=1 Tax=Halorarius halobius TaxID=2962671 RepID=UPI0020CC6E6D|nr:signal peptidase I [Halorarius halobius]
MDPRRAARLAGGGLLALLLVTVVVGQLLGQPVLLSYVTTGSMEPTLHPGDGFVAVPSAVAGPVEEGDVVVFRAETLHGGGLTTHRVVEETPRGYITKGDANPFTDQDGGEPPVTEEQIVAQGFEVGGQLLVIPNLGVPAMAAAGALTGLQRGLATLLGTRSLLGTQGLAYLLFAVGAGAYAIEAVRERGRGARRETDRRDRRPGVVDARVVVAALVVLVLVGVTAAMVVPSGGEALTVVSSSSDSPRPNVVAAGTTQNVTYSFRNTGLLPAVVMLDSGDPNLTFARDQVVVPGGSRANVSATVTAPDRTGVVQYGLSRHWYLAVVPPSTVRTLYAVHPVVPLLAIDALVGAGVGLVGVSVLGTGPLRFRESGITVRDRLRAWLRR